jgi:hypothetical protein
MQKVRSVVEVVVVALLGVGAGYGLGLLYKNLFGD